MHHPKQKDSRLAILLERHTRFNLFYNYAGHNLFTPIKSQDWTFPHCFRITQNDFNFLNVARTQHYYYLTDSNQSGHNVDKLSFLSVCGVINVKAVLDEVTDLVQHYKRQKAAAVKRHAKKVSRETRKHQRLY